MLLELGSGGWVTAGRAAKASSLLARVGRGRQCRGGDVQVRRLDAFCAQGQCSPSWASAEAGGNGSTYKEELVEFFPHGLADMFLHQWEHLHKVLRQRVGGVAGECGYLQI